MAKGLRSKSKIAARNARRYTPGTDYAVTPAARMHQVSSRLAERLKQPPAYAEEADAGENEEEAMDAEGEDGAAPAPGAAMQEDEAPKKVSTSGPRGSRKELWRRKRGKPIRGPTSKNNGRVKRRR